ncbi:histone-like nucleoid-structuring protein Lsr2 [Georgenia sp. MJ173]|uniref:exonuclease domain-containing protein n=1 Tax=Georgenia sunbinii TaxID=3117728 RepID=UPI002F25FF9C
MRLLEWIRGRRAGKQAVPAVPPIAADQHRRPEIAATPAVFAVVDVETTGLSPKADRILDLAIVRVDARGEVIDEWTTLINPEGPVGASHIHGITQRDVAHAPAFRDVADLVTARLSDLTVAAHNARFDLAFIRAEYSRSGHALPWLSAVCTLEVSRHYFPSLDRRRLADCCAAAGVQLLDAHSALGDARATAGLLRRYVDTPPMAHDIVLATQPRAATSSPLRVPTPARAPVPRAVRRPPPRPSPAALVSVLADFTLAEVIDEGAPEGSMAYLELLAEALQDAELSEPEHAALQDVASIYDMTPEDVESANRAMLLALCHLAMDDGRITVRERDELQHVAEILQLDTTIVSNLLAHVTEARQVRLSAGLQQLPPDCSGGEPLRVADRVAFTGGDPSRRARLEQRAEALGIRVMGNVSSLTKVLVTDGSFVGTKARRAAEHQTRLVDHDQFERLLTHLQPAMPRTHGGAGQPMPTAPMTQALPTETPAAIRRWAQTNGHVVAARGRLPLSVLAAYRTAHRVEDGMAQGTLNP